VQSNMIVGFKTDCQDPSAMILMNEILGGTPTSKLFSNVREKMSLCYSCFSSYNWLKGSISVRCGVEKEKIERAYEEILNQLDMMKKGEFSEEDIVSAKMYRKNYLKTFYDNLNAMAAWYMSRIYSDDLASPKEMMKRDENITKEDIIKAAQSVKLDTFYVLTSDDNS
ncbi:MAG: insulinase family protein, partial [Ruminiclostridium sp.]|nr:insulinase family protein [Ruminiclostridium sp.]